MFKELFDQSMICKDPTEGECTMLTYILLLTFDISIKMKSADKEF
jgi:hypothetical protein